MKSVAKMIKISRLHLTLVRELNHKFFGNLLSEHKEHLIQNRLKRLFRNQTQYKTVTQMLEAISEGELVQEFINVFTTNKTSFFREEIHFEDLLNRVFPEHFSHSNDIKIYSCASSSGEEPYSIAITFLHYRSQSDRHLDATVYATDIDTDILDVASAAVYPFDEKSSPFPRWVRPQLYFQRRINDHNGSALIRANNQLRALTRFKQHNLLNHEAAFGTTKFDVIFCRNVLIYLSLEDQERVLRNLFSTLKIGGTLYTGHSETPSSLYPFVDKIAPSIYKKHSELV